MKPAQKCLHSGFAGILLTNNCTRVSQRNPRVEESKNPAWEFKARRLLSVCGALTIGSTFRAGAQRRVQQCVTDCDSDPDLDQRQHNASSLAARAQVSAWHLQFASAFGVEVGLTKAKPIATATAILISVNILLVFFFWPSPPGFERPQLRHLRRSKPKNSYNSQRVPAVTSLDGTPEPCSGRS
jgi:hypothetical protein